MTAPDQLGRRVAGRYRLVRQLGSGGFGRVWEAHDEALDVRVAVKEVWVPQQAASDAEHREYRGRLARAAREARNAAKLRDHPHIVAVHDVVIEQDSPWIVMRLVNGRSLDNGLRANGPMPAGRVVELATALLKALQVAHAAGIVHRDLKPANVMLDADGEVLLADFGIAVHWADTKLTADGGVIGSIEYMAPERINGDEDRGAGDLFALGVTLYEAVEGISPFRRHTPTATMAAVVLDDPPPPRRAGPVLTALITALLAKQPEDRPTVGGALAMLNSGGRTPDSPSRPGPAPAWTTARARPQLMPVVPRVLCVVVGGFCALLTVSFTLLAISIGASGYPLLATMGSAALPGLSAGVAATLFRWTRWGRPPAAFGARVFAVISALALFVGQIVKFAS